MGLRSGAIRLDVHCWVDMFCNSICKELQESEPTGTGIEFVSPELHIKYIWAENVRVVFESPEFSLRMTVRYGFPVVGA